MLSALSGIEFQWTINLGTLLQLVGIVSAVMLAYMDIRVRLARLEVMIVPLWRWWNKDILEKSDDEINHEIRALQSVQLARKLRKEKKHV